MERRRDSPPTRREAWYSTGPTRTISTSGRCPLAATTSRASSSYRSAARRARGTRTPWPSSATSPSRSRCATAPALPAESISAPTAAASRSLISAAAVGTTRWRPSACARRISPTTASASISLTSSRCDSTSARHSGRARAASSSTI